MSHQKSPRNRSERRKMSKSLYGKANLPPTLQFLSGDEENRELVSIDYVPCPIMKRMYQKVQRNDPCPCGSGKKFKNCLECYKKFGEARAYYTDEMIEDNIKEFKEKNDGQD